MTWTQFAFKIRGAQARKVWVKAKFQAVLPEDFERA